ncbi:queuine tRNA-ribosyltransferase catalytic subunit 1-like isoform X1 [Portunus trituberculatus]|uniref:queuine tRNA-ribosyltransferase catalytic subunit 1-like isoform X1 n=2 Tax=Portunus trituberculatus TaxID=210409 RepID=UPI001E1CDF6C|nr:queuine tRNA-ribosyltransferase catalytic subunit 1-like isoform X1 [Portunus trituberculatus]
MASLTTVGNSSPALSFRILAECGKSKARTSLMTLPHQTVELPAFMPVGTQGTMKGLLPQQVKDTGAGLILGNTYHLGTQPGKENLTQLGGLHKFMNWDQALLTDSGGFQMVSLLKLAEITEEGVKFRSPYDGSECLLTPEESIAIQNAIGADIMMQLDDVVNVVEKDYKRFEVATHRTTRWLDRCIAANKNRTTQNLFPIVQGGLFPDLREISLQQLIARDAPGYAIGGLSGGEDKDKFWPVVLQCTEQLPHHKPRYCMGVGMAVDLVVCCALGVDMFDCVFPTRTARFGCALVDYGQINLKNKEFSGDLRPIDEACDCSTCKSYSRAYINTIVTREPVACHLLSVHNIAYQMRLMRQIRESIKNGQFEEFVREFVEKYYKGQECPKWVTDALAAVNIHLHHKKICRKNPKDETNTSDEVWNDEDDEPMDERRQGMATRVEGVTGLQSGFEHLNLTGYREAILGDFEQSEELGRCNGFQSGFVADPKINPSLALARMEGQLMALSHKTSQREEEAQAAEMEQVLKQVKTLADLCYSTPLTPVKQPSALSPHQQPCQGKVDSNTLRKLQDRIDQLYSACGWTVPDLP